MTDILTTIVEKRKEDIACLGVTFGFKIPEKRQRPVHPFLMQKGVSLEVKRASPSKGDIAPDLNSAETARSYAIAGAAAISCLTETNYFKGTLGDLMAVCEAVPDTAVLRKDFLLTAEEVEVAYRAGADAVLLIARILEKPVIIEMAKAAAAHKMTSLIEVRSEDDIQKLAAVAASVDHEFIVCGVNSRDLATFKIDLLKPCAMLNKIRAVLSDDARVIFESGIRTPEAAHFAGSLGFTGMLLGEAAAKNPGLRSELVKSFVEAKSNRNAEFWNEYSNISMKKNNVIVGLAPTICTSQSIIDSLVKPGNDKPLIKICGLTRSEDVLFADSQGAVFVGFIFAAGFARNVCGERFEKILPSLKKVKAKKVAVITDPDSMEAETAARYVEEGSLDCLQLHGIPYEKVPHRFLDLPHYFAITEKSGNIKDSAEKLFLMGEPRFLQDSKAQNYDTNHKLWLAGGITPENVAELVTRFQPELIDIASGVEDPDNPGIKNHNKIRVILNLFQDL